MSWILNISKWVENLWNLKSIFDKYLPLIKQHVQELQKMKTELEALRTTVSDVKETEQ